VSEGRGWELEAALGHALGWLEGRAGDPSV
jgi:hypothetical protein